MSVEQFTVDQLREELERFRIKYKSDLSEKDAEIRELKASIKVKKRVEHVVHAEYTYEYFPKFAITILNRIDPKKKLSHAYIKSCSLINYIIVCGTGVIINNLVQKFLYSYTGEALNWMVINNLAIIIAFLWNYTMSVGPLGFFWGLSPKIKKEKMI